MRRASRNRSNKLDQTVPGGKRRAAFQLGLSAESRAALLLVAKGYRILARRWKTPFGEIDIIARRRRVLIFVEVKARERLDGAAEALTEQQQRRIINAAQIWLASHPDAASGDIRFDAILVIPRRIPHHIVSAFDASP